jgi:hypothetical protein
MGAQLTATDEELQRLARHRLVVRQCARRYRARKRKGARCLRIEISNAAQTLDAFVNIGVLADDRRNDDKAIEHAIAVLCRRGYRAIAAEQETDRDDTLALEMLPLRAGPKRRVSSSDQVRRARHTSPEATPPA